MTNEEIKTTGQLRSMLARTLQEVNAGAMDVTKAIAIHKIARNIAESLYSETKIAMLRNELQVDQVPFGALEIGDPTPDPGLQLRAAAERAA